MLPGERKPAALWIDFWLNVEIRTTDERLETDDRQGLTPTKTGRTNPDLLNEK